MRCQSQEVLILGRLLRQLILSSYIISTQHRMAGRRKASPLIQNVCLSLSRLKPPLQELGFAALLLSLFPEKEHPDSVRILGSSRKGFHSS